jgi:hypothetical protein
MKWLDKRAAKELEDYVRATYRRIGVKAGVCRFNYRCHNNAVHDAIRDGDETVALVIYVEDGYPIVHFVNVHEGEFVDNTLGEWSQRYDYYYVRHIERDEFWSVEMVWMFFRKALGRNLRFVTKLFSEWRG